jgi:hypothetical protein
MVDLKANLKRDSYAKLKFMAKTKKMEEYANKDNIWTMS